MGQRKPSTLTARSPYKYQSLAECEEAEDFHVVTPTTWPPPRIGSTPGDPSLSAVCELCGCNLIVYEGHDTGALQGIRVVKPEKPSKKTA